MGFLYLIFLYICDKFKRFHCQPSEDEAKLKLPSAHGKQTEILIVIAACIRNLFCRLTIQSFHDKDTMSEASCYNVHCYHPCRTWVRTDPNMQGYALYTVQGYALNPLTVEVSKARCWKVRSLSGYVITLFYTTKMHFLPHGRERSWILS